MSDDDFSSLAKSAEGDIVDDNLEVAIDGEVKEAEVVDDKDIALYSSEVVNS